MSTNLSGEDHDDTHDYVVGDEDGEDNEDTIAEDELHELDEDNDLDALQAEAEMDIEELRKRYYGNIIEANESQHAGSSDATGDGEEDDTSEEEEEVSAELVQFMTTENGELQDDDEDDDFVPKIYKPPRVGPEYQVLRLLITSIY
jgi:hypothetical protein